jgi:osmoprotectant transport system ATP-binding protein
MGDKIVLMKDGYLVQYGSPADLIYKPRNSFVADFVGADRALKGLQLVRTKEVMSKAPPTASLQEDGEIVRERMTAAEIDWLAVIDEAGGFAGWVLAQDLEQGIRVKDVLKTSMVTATENATLSESLSIMLTSNPGVLVVAVVDRQNRLEGVLSFEAIQLAVTGIGKSS